MSRTSYDTLCSYTYVYDTNFVNNNNFTLRMTISPQIPLMICDKNLYLKMLRISPSSQTNTHRN